MSNPQYPGNHLSLDLLLELLKSVKRVHFIGLSSPFCGFPAAYLLKNGATVTASEAFEVSITTNFWDKHNVLRHGGHNAENITEDLQLVIFPNGIIPNNPEVKKTIETTIPYVFIQELVGAISLNFKTIAIAGSQGKTTTTSLIVWLLRETIGTSSFMVGNADDSISELNTNWEIHPESEYLVMEACEYKRQFIARVPQPFISVITHIDYDHIDYYPTQKSYNQAFVDFLGPTKHSIIIDDERPNEQWAWNKYSNKTVSRAKQLRVSELRKKFVYIDCPQLLGRYNQENLLRAAGLGLILGLEENQIRKALKTFPGVSSRFEFVGKTKNGMPVHTNFSHSPIKISACLQGAAEIYPTSKIIAIYQPKGHQKTSAFLDDFVRALRLADTIVLPNIHSYAETKQQKAIINADQLATAIKKCYPDKNVFSTNDESPYSRTISLTKKFDRNTNVLVVIRSEKLDKLIDGLLT